jgi:hypothetical protein
MAPANIALDAARMADVQVCSTNLDTVDTTMELRCMRAYPPFHEKILIYLSSQFNKEVLSYSKAEWDTHAVKCLHAP